LKSSTHVTTYLALQWAEREHSDQLIKKAVFSSRFLE